MSEQPHGEPQPGDFDAELAQLGAGDVTYVEADPSRDLIVRRSPTNESAADTDAPDPLGDTSESGTPI